MIIALKSANEATYWLCLIRVTIEVDQNPIAGLLKDADAISNIIAKIIIHSAKDE